MQKLRCKSMHTPSWKTFSRLCAQGTAFLLLVLTAEYAWSHSVPSAATATPDDYGVLIMAHGGSPEWNRGVLAAVKPLRDQIALEVAFGMADAVTLQEAVSRLEARGIRKIGVVRLFVSGESWYERTEQILGLRPGAPTAPIAPDHLHQASHEEHTHSMEFWKIRTEASFALSKHGLAEAEITGTVLADRARELSHDPERENVLILAHGPGDDAENERWIADIDVRAEAVRKALPFRRVQVMTLREDWPEKRKEAERRIRGFVENARDEGIVTIVVPFRVHGFGPYAEVLDGLDYVADGRGLIPHADIMQWIAREIETLRGETFRSSAE